MWRTKQTPICGKRKREDDDDGEKMNSSFQILSFARITNTRVKAGKKPHLLTLPDDIRKHIFRFALVEATPISVSARSKEACSASGLMEVCHDIRDEALEIFYTENDFDLQVHEFDAAALLPWLKKAEGHRSKSEMKAETKSTQPASTIHPVNTFDAKTLSPTQTWMLEKQHIYRSGRTPLSASLPGSPSWSIPFEPNWANYVTWLKLFHAREMAGPPRYEDGEFDPDDEVGKGAAFTVAEVVDGLKEEKWEIVEKVLPGLRKVLGTGEPRWLDDHGQAVKNEEGGESDVAWEEAEG